MSMMSTSTAAGRSDAGRTEPEGQRIEPLDVEPDGERAGMVVGAGADGRPGVGETEERKQRSRDHHRGDRGIELGRIDDQAADLEAVETVASCGRSARRVRR